MKFNITNFITSMQSVHKSITSENFEESLEKMKDICHSHIKNKRMANDIYLFFVGTITMGRMHVHLNATKEKEKYKLCEDAQELLAEMVATALNSYEMAENLGGVSVIEKIIKKNPTKTHDELVDILQTELIDKDDKEI